MNTALRKFAIFAVVGFGSPAFAAPVTYDFIGTITGASGIYGSAVAVGNVVSGTYTFDLAAANPAQSVGTIGATNWTAMSYGGVFWGTTAPSSVVFSSSVQLGALHVSTTLQTFADSSQIYGHGNYYDAFMAAYSNPQTYTRADLNIGYGSNTGSPFSGDGLPILLGHIGVGSFVSASPAAVSRVDFTVTSLTPAIPEPETYAMMLAGLGLLGVAARRRKQKSAA
jgi:hypothetical protein